MNHLLIINNNDNLIAAQNKKVNGGFMFSKIHHICDYCPTRILGQKNPAFNNSRESKLLLDTKKTTHQNHKVAITYFIGKLESYLKRHNFDIEGFTAAVIPSSTAHNYSAGLVSILQGLKIKLTIQPDLLIRHTDITALHHGGERLPYIHTQSMRVNHSILIPDKNIILLDDITTSGNSYIASADLLNAAGFKANIFRLALGKTSYEQ